MEAYLDEETKEEYVARRLAEMNAPFRPTPRDTAGTRLYHAALTAQMPVARAPSGLLPPSGAGAATTPAAPTTPTVSGPPIYRNFSLPLSATAPATTPTPAASTTSAHILEATGGSRDQEPSLPSSCSGAKPSRLQKPKAFFRKVSGAITNTFRHNEPKAEATTEAGHATEGQALPVPGVAQSGEEDHQAGTSAQMEQHQPAHPTASSAPDPFASEKVLDLPVDSPLSSSPVAESTPRAHRHRTSPESPKSPTRNVRRARHVNASQGKSAGRASATSPGDGEDDAERKRKHRIAPTPEEMEVMTEDLRLLELHYPQVQALVQRPPRECEPTDASERFDWAFAIVKSSLSEQQKQPTAMAENISYTPLGQTHGEPRATSYQPPREEDSEDQDLNHPENRI
ncbi:hypothetical protein GQ53DRAFT_860145 [Thozetella sp. PMI_491]|nr:hypothetical protein GQ53DRAFT_860145 [Thozetella sp. PMI_491]